VSEQTAGRCFSRHCITARKRWNSGRFDAGSGRRGTGYPSLSSPSVRSDALFDLLFEGDERRKESKWRKVVDEVGHSDGVLTYGESLPAPTLEAAGYPQEFVQNALGIWVILKVRSSGERDGVSAVGIPSGPAQGLLIEQQPSFLHSDGNDADRWNSHSIAEPTESGADLLDTCITRLRLCITMNTQQITWEQFQACFDPFR
jgi:hypothetical protein